MHRFRVLKSKISKFYPKIHDLRILCRDFRFYLGGQGPQLRGRISRGRRLRSTGPQTPPSPLQRNMDELRSR